MTCIVGLVDPENGNRVYIGGDSAGCSPGIISLRKDPKVFRNGPFLMGYAGSYRMGQLLRYSFNPPERASRRDVYQYMITDWVDEVRKTLKDGGEAKVEDNVEETSGQALIAYRNRLFMLDEDFQVAEHITPYVSIGVGSEIALGSLHTTDKFKIDPEAKVRLALEAAAFISDGVRAPFIIERL